MIRKLTAAIAGVTLAGLGGCSGTPESHYYLLGSDADIASEDRSADGPVLFVDPTTIAPYADRSQMVTRAADGQVTFAEFEVWAQPIGSLITAALVDELARRFGPDRVMATPARIDLDADYRLGVDVLRLDTNEAGEVVLDARWTLLGGADQHVVTTRRTRLVERPADPTSHPQRVAAVNEALVQLGSQIAEEISSAAPATNRMAPGS